MPGLTAALPHFPPQMSGSSRESSKTTAKTNIFTSMSTRNPLGGGQNRESKSRSCSMQPYRRDGGLTQPTTVPSGTSGRRGSSGLPRNGGAAPPPEVGKRQAFRPGFSYGLPKQGAASPPMSGSAKPSGQDLMRPPKVGSRYSSR